MNRASDPGQRRRPSRRAVLRLAALAVLAPVPIALVSFLERLGATRQPAAPVVVPPGAADPVTFAGDVIVCRDQANTVRVFSARCPHLGCQITRVVDGLLVCPCHGSRFHLDGRVATGPAPHPLTPLPHEIDSRSGALVIHQ